MRGSDRVPELPSFRRVSPSPSIVTRWPSARYCTSGRGAPGRATSTNCSALPRSRTTCVHSFSFGFFMRGSRPVLCAHVRRTSASVIADTGRTESRRSNAGTSSSRWLACVSFVRAHSLRNIRLRPSRCLGRSMPVLPVPPYRWLQRPLGERPSMTARVLVRYRSIPDRARRLTIPRRRPLKKPDKPVTRDRVA